jgi:SOS-response transcriptional repressor LexA
MLKPQSNRPGKVGAPKKPDEALSSRRKEILFTEQEWEQLEAALAPGQRAGTLIRNIVIDYLEGRLSGQHTAATDQQRVKFLSKATCGNWREAIDNGMDYVLSADVADTLEARDKDVMVMTDGDSMEGAGIPDGAMLLMRPLPDNVPPRRNEIALVQIIDADGNCESTIKRWTRGGPTPTDVILEDGDGARVDLPPDTVRVQAVAVARGLITKV